MDDEQYEDSLPITCSWSDEYDNYYLYKIWHLPDRNPHRAAGPACFEQEVYTHIRRDVHMYWKSKSIYCFDGCFHRNPKAGPAIEYNYEDTSEDAIGPEHNIYCWFGKQHRPDGPAKVATKWSNNEYIFYGRRYNKCKRLLSLELVKNDWAMLALNLNSIVAWLYFVKKSKWKWWEPQQDLWEDTVFRVTLAPRRRPKRRRVAY